MATKKKWDVHEYLGNIADEMGKKHIQKINSKLSGEDPGLKYLKIPIVGGVIYLFSSYDRARKVVQKNKHEIYAKQNNRIISKEHNSIRRNMERQISDILLNQQVSKINVPEQYLGDFLAVVKDMDVGVKQIGDSEFLVVAKEGVVM